MSTLPSVLFVCQHGAAKSVIAAEHLRRLAAERGVEIDTASAGLEPDAEIPPHVVDGLRRDGIDVGRRVPAALTADAVERAARIVVLAGELGALETLASAPVTRWDDVPAVSDGYDAARDAIVARLAALLDEHA